VRESLPERVDQFYQSFRRPSIEPGGDLRLDGSQNIEADATGLDPEVVDVLNVVDTRHEGISGDPHEEQTPGMVGDPDGGTGGMVGDRTTMEEVRDQVQHRGEQVVAETADRMGAVNTVRAVEPGNPPERTDGSDPSKQPVG